MTSRRARQVAALVVAGLLLVAVAGCRDTRSSATHAAESAAVNEREPPPTTLAPGDARDEIDAPETDPPSTDALRSSEASGTVCTNLALAYLARTQRRDGAWDGGSPTGDLAATGAAVLCFLGYGETHRSGDHRDTVKRGLRFLQRQQAEDGGFGIATTNDARLAQLLASAAFTETYRITSSRVFKTEARSAGAFLVRAIEARTYVPSDDPVVEFWHVLALWSAHRSEVVEAWPALRRLVDLLDLESRRGPDWAALRLLAFRWTGGAAASADPRREADRRLLLDAGGIAAASRPDQALARTVALRVDGRAWSDGKSCIRAALVRRQITERDSAERGSWPAAAEASWRTWPAPITALSELTLEVCFDVGCVIATGERRTW